MQVIGGELEAPRKSIQHLLGTAGLPAWMRLGKYAVVQPKTDPILEKQAFNSQEEALQSQLDLIKKRLIDLDSSSWKMNHPCHRICLAMMLAALDNPAGNIRLKVYY